MINKKFYVTTPIYYGNGLPHIGHFYASTIADIFNKYKKISGYDTKFTTGIDENSQKIVQKAEELGIDVMDYLDEMAKKHRETWDFFGFSYDDFIRTTSKRHEKIVQKVLQKCFDRGDIYEGEYEGMYCVGCEAFKKDEDLVYMNKTSSETFPITPEIKPSENIIKVCPDHLKVPDNVKEKNYFFKLSKYQTWLEEFYENNPDFVLPDFRFNEVKAFVKRGLEDFSISRETNTFGIKLPFDDTQVTYVWFDALFNYYTSCVYSPKNEDLIDEANSNINCDEDIFENKKDFWESEIDNREILHVVGKDIIRFHAIYWPAMLVSYFSLGEEKNGILHFTKKDLDFLPTNILTTGFFTVDGQKMSKSLGNVIEPIEYCEKYSQELLRLYILSAFTIGRDGDYDRKDAILNYNAKLANNFGNLLNRGIVLTQKLDLKNGLNSEIDDNISEKLKGYNLESIKSMVNFDLKNTLDSSFKFLNELNLYVTEKEPWTLMKNKEKIDETKQILYTTLESLRQVGLNLYAFFPEKMSKLFENLALKDYEKLLENGEFKNLKNKKEIFDIKEKSSILFEKFDI